MSKLYDALRKREQERTGSSEPPGPGRPPGPPGPPEPPAPPGRPPHDPTIGGDADDRAPLALPSLVTFPDSFWRSVGRVAAAIQANARRESSRILFVGAEPGAGTTTLALGTCCLLVRDPGVEVILVDAHARQDGTRLLPNRKRGLIQIAMGEAEANDVIVPTEMRGLRFLPRGSGSYNGPKLLEKLVPLLSTLHTRYDYIVLDAAPVVTAPESAQLAGFADGVIVVMSSERTPKAEATRTKEILDQHKAPVLGTVLNRVRRTSLLGHR